MQAQGYFLSCHARTIARLIGAAGLLSVYGAVSALTVDHLVSFGPGQENAAEIAAFDAESNVLFVTNAEDNRLERFDLSDPANPVTLTAINLAPFGGGPNSVAVANGVVAVAVEAVIKQDPGAVVLFNTKGIITGLVPVGALPDMLVFTPDGDKILVANEGEPSDDYTIDPEGSISIIDLTQGADQASVSTIGFSDFNAGGPREGEVPADLRVFGPGASLAEDLEPEYITVDESGARAWVSLQENNGLAIVDIEAESIEALVSLGFKDHSLPGNELDASDRDGPGGGSAINIVNWPLLGMYQPDALAAFTVNGVSYVLSANEGDARDYDAFSEEARIKNLTLDPTVFPDAATLQEDANLGRLQGTDATGDTDDDGDFDALYAYGARSFSVWDGATGQLLWDSGSRFETVTSALGLPFFNNDDGRSDNKGPEPEGITTGVVENRRYAFIGLERVNGFFVYDLSTPDSPALVRFVPGQASDARPEGLLFVTADDSPNGTPLLLLTNEDSGTVAIYQLTLEDRVHFDRFEQ